MTVPVCGIAIVNWNGWADTLECLEAILKMDAFEGPIVVVDNASTDGSVEMFNAWAEGRLCAMPESRHAAIWPLVVPPAPKPAVSWVRPDQAAPTDVADSRVFFLLSQRNGGFAAGNNLALRWLVDAGGCAYYWLVNNDALPLHDAYVELLRGFESGSRGAQIAGSVLLHYHRPDMVQAIGGKFNRHGATSQHMGEGLRLETLQELPRRLPVDYPVGAGLAVNAEYISRYGLMAEEYFLYFEEIDWVLRAGWPSKTVAFTRSRLYHKGGNSTENRGDPAARSLFADYFIVRNRILLASKISFVARWSAVLVGIISILRRIVRPIPGGARNAALAILDGIMGRSGPSRRHRR